MVKILMELGWSKEQIIAYFVDKGMPESDALMLYMIEAGLVESDVFLLSPFDPVPDFVD